MRNLIPPIRDSSIAVDISTEIDESLIGGIKLRMGNFFLDGTIHGQLERMKTGLI